MKQQDVIESEPNSADSAATSEYYPTNENYDSGGQYWHHQHPYPIYPDQHQYQYQCQDRLRTLGPYEEYDPNMPAVTLKSESENPAPLNWELEAHWNSESGIDCNPQVEYQFKQEFADYSPVYGNQDASDVIDPSTSSPHDLHQYNLKEFERGCYLVQNEFGQFELLSEPDDYAPFAAGSDETRAQDEHVSKTYRFFKDTSDVIDPNILSPHDQFILKEFERGCYLVQNGFGQFELLSEPDYAQFSAGSDETRAQDERLMLYNIGQLQEGFYPHLPTYPDF